MHMCLWGNATDLSLLTNMTHADIQKLQTVSKSEQADRAQYILKDDGPLAWDLLNKSHQDKSGASRVDFILDNAGFELYTDLIFGEFLVTVLGIDKVVFHPKSFPWFVSDVTPPDFSQTIRALQQPELWATKADSGEEQVGSSASEPHTDSGALKELARRFQERVQSGQFELSVSLDTPLDATSDAQFEFWTEPYAYHYMQEIAPRLWEYLCGSTLVIFKGDLNYRKLTGDVKWPVDTSFSEALGPLRGSFPILALRTNKADVAVGVAAEVAQELDEKGEKWRVNGKYALISFEPRTT